MSKSNLKISKPNDAWVIHREEVHTTQDGYCSIYVILDAHSSFAFGFFSSKELPKVEEVSGLLDQAYSKALFWPRTIVVSKKDPNLANLSKVCEKLKISVTQLPPQDLKPYVERFSSGFKESALGAPRKDEMPQEEQDELEAFIPDSYSPCTCGSGKKFRFCCQPIFRDITFAMCAAQERRPRRPCST